MHINSHYPETFGLVYTEANAVGTPFHSHGLAANFETMDHPDERIAITDTDGVVERILDWRAGGRIAVGGNPSFRLPAVAGE